MVLRAWIVVDCLDSEQFQEACWSDARVGHCNDAATIARENPRHLMHRALIVFDVLEDLAAQNEPDRSRLKRKRRSACHDAHWGSCAWHRRDPAAEILQVRVMQIHTDSR